MHRHQLLDVIVIVLKKVKIQSLSHIHGNHAYTSKINVKNCSLSTTYNGEMTHRKQQK